MSLGLALIVQNEEIHIPSTISQFYLVVDRIVVVDGGSSDSTVEWCKRMGAELYHRPFKNDFANQKNYAASLLGTDWIYCHDADERLEPTLLDVLPSLLTEKGQKVLMSMNIIPENQNMYDCFGFARRTFIDGNQIPVYPDYQYRLFRNYCRYEGRVHEQITGFKNRTELDYTRTSPPMANEDGFDFTHTSRFNLLHYKSSLMQQAHDELYKRILSER